MSQSKEESFRLGFLTAIEDVERGFVGGLLVTNRFGRPLEFQCTAPVKPNRAQQILYGTTLRPYIMGELIGRTLIEKVAVKPHVVLVDSIDVLDLRLNVSLIVACLAGAGANKTETIRLGKHQVMVHPDFEADLIELQRHSKLLTAEADFSEPFERVREALSETVRHGVARSA